MRWLLLSSATAVQKVSRGVPLSPESWHVSKRCVPAPGWHPWIAWCLLRGIVQLPGAPQDQSFQGNRQGEPCEVRCWSCHQLGHLTAQCPRREEPMEYDMGRHRSMYAHALCATTNLNLHECVVRVNGQDVVALLDSGCHHPAQSRQVANKAGTKGTGRGHLCAW